MNRPQPASHLAVISAWWCRESVTQPRDGDFGVARSAIMETNPLRPFYQRDFEWAKLFINFGHGVINVRKREENSQTNSSSMMAVLMITTKSVLEGDWVSEHERDWGWDGVMLKECWRQTESKTEVKDKEMQRKVVAWMRNKGKCVGTIVWLYHCLKEKGRERKQGVSQMQGG